VTKRTRSDVLIVVPALNEEDALPSVLKELADVVPHMDVLVVDDGSTDATAIVAREAGATVAELPYNLGVGGALRTGFFYAVRNGYDRAIQFDADGQHDAREIAKLLAQLDDGADMVIGSRFASDDHTYEVGRVRAGGMRLLRLAVIALSGERVSDTSSGFRAFSRPLLEFFARNYPVEYLGDTVEALLLACYAGFKVAEVPVSMRSRAGGQPSTRNLRLVYHYVRLLIVLLSTASIKGRRRAP
jgi:glycosyltransferase involved in cell wall biosynthesis